MALYFSTLSLRLTFPSRIWLWSAFSRQKMCCALPITHTSRLRMSSNVQEMLRQERSNGLLQVPSKHLAFRSKAISTSATRSPNHQDSQLRINLRRSFRAWRRLHVLQSHRDWSAWRIGSSQVDFETSTCLGVEKANECCCGTHDSRRMVVEDALMKVVI